MDLPVGSCLYARRAASLPASAGRRDLMGQCGADRARADRQEGTGGARLLERRRGTHSTPLTCHIVAIGPSVAAEASLWGAPVTHWKKRSEEHTSELQSLMRISYAVFCLKKKKTHQKP